MNKYLEKFAQRVAKDALKHGGELFLEVCEDKLPALQPLLRELWGVSKKGSRSLRESEIRDRLASGLAGSQTEVPTKTGKIDILTPSRVIEVKNVKNYKHAIGQVLSYGCYYPRRERWVYLFGSVSWEQRCLIERECKVAGVFVCFLD